MGATDEKEDARRRALFGVERERENVGDARVTRPDALPFSPLFVASLSRGEWRQTLL